MPPKLVRTASRIDVCRLTNCDKRVVVDQQGAKDIHRVIRRGINSSTRNANTKVEINWTTTLSFAGQDHFILLRGTFALKRWNVIGAPDMYVLFLRNRNEN
ncbi:hypothetical protein OUZ56_009203 [Daphnia magna]|uniref:Uncharacterized protein n=1 Tax=Daphnia magna TaxID=35525 RepID=A0ABR0AFA0_9CRUS|nr:hypothetical protein OUZ56_009203 [Daphnia magna]